MERKQLARLLSGRNEPSVLEKEALLDGILARADAGRQRPRRLRLMVGMLTSLVGAVAGTLLFLHIRPSPDAPEFASRGGAGLVVRLACLESPQAGACTLGDTLAFEVGGVPRDRGYFAAFSRRPDGVVVWYFPTAEGRSEAIDPARGLLKQAVRLGPPHIPGLTKVVMVLSRSPLTRAEIKKTLDASPAASDGTLVIERTILLKGGQ